MWNEVILLASGLGLGWSLVNLMVCPAEQVRSNLLTLTLAGCAGLVMVVWLAVSSLSSGLAAVLVVLGTAVIAYAANARQANRQPAALPPHPPSVSPNAAGSAVLLVTNAEPSQYNGPEYWAKALLQQDQAPHWFVRPLGYYRIRQAYERMGNQHPLDARLAALVEQLSVEIPQAHFDYVYLGEQRTLLAKLVEVAESGINRLVFVLLEDEPQLPEKLKDLVKRSGLNETSLDIIYAPVYQLSTTAHPARMERLRLLQAGQPPQVPQLSGTDKPGLAIMVNQILKQATPLSNI